jgi:hypothetical protein
MQILVRQVWVSREVICGVLRLDEDHHTMF